MFIKVLGQDERDADLLFRIYRRFRLRNVGDERPFSTLRRSIEHEALIALKARDVGIRTPHLLTVATVEPNAFLLAYATVDGASLDRVEQPWSDDLLRGIWEQVALLRRERIAHRDLRRANLFVDADGVPWVIDFGFSELAVSDLMLAQDLAQLIVALAIGVGADRAVDSAIHGIGAETVGTALPYLQLPAFAGATQQALKEKKGLLEQVRTAVVERTGTPEVQYEPLTRFSIRTVLMLVCSLIALYVLIPQFADVTGMFRQLKDANWGLVGGALVFSALTYVGAAISLIAACPVPVRPFNAVEVAFAGSFVNRITPAGIGGIGLNLRFMQKAGANTVEAASRWGVNAMAGGVVHISLAAMFILWAGKDGAFDFSLPEMPLLVAFAVISVASGVIFLTPFGRDKLLGPARRVARHAVGRSSRHRAPTGASRDDVRRRYGRRARQSVRALRIGQGVRRHHVVRRSGCRVPGRIRDRPGRADSGRSRCGGGDPHRRAGRCRPRQGDRGPRGAAVPFVHVLDPDPAGLGVVRAPVAPQSHLMGPPSLGLLFRDGGRHRAAFDRVHV